MDKVRSECGSHGDGSGYWHNLGFGRGWRGEGRKVVGVRGWRWMSERRDGRFFISQTGLL